MLEDSIIAKLESIRIRSTEINEALAKEGATDDMAHFTQLNKEFAEITPIVDLFQSLQDVEKELSGAKELLDSGDSELIELAKIEVTANQEKISELEKNLKFMLLPKDEADKKNAIIEIRARGVPLGLGAPIYSKLDMDLAAAMMSINAVKGVNIGSGMGSAMITGEENSDEILQRKGKTSFKSRNLTCVPALRPAALLLLAMLAADGVSILKDVYSISRGYEDLVNRLNSVGAKIEFLQGV